jgi:hypothetical protein
LGVAAAHVNEGGLEGGAGPHAEDGGKKHGRLGRATPVHVLAKVLRKLGDREDEDEVEDQLDRGDLVALPGAAIDRAH